MSWVILVRNPRTGGVLGITDPDDEGALQRYDSEADANTAAREHHLCHAWPHVVVEAP